ncbi:MAG: OmpH family outer membrane protein, partial [Nitrospinota bacterium]
MRTLKYKLQVTSYKLQVIFLASCILHLASSISFAESLKIGYVDIQKALNQSTAGKSAMEKLKKDIEKETTILKEK